MSTEEESLASLFSLVELGDKEKLLEILANSENQKELSVRNKHGRTALDTAALLGRVDIVQALVDNGADLNKANKSGYTALHHSAAWGRLECLKALVSLGANHLHTTRHKETSRDIAMRYSKVDCAKYLDAVDSRCKLSQAIKSAKDTLADSEKISGKWNKDDRSKVNGLCNEKNDWLQNNQEVSSEDICQQTLDFEQRFQPYLAKLAPPDST